MSDMELNYVLEYGNAATKERNLKTGEFDKAVVGIYRAISGLGEVGKRIEGGMSTDKVYESDKPALLKMFTQNIEQMTGISIRAFREGQMEQR